MVLRKLEKHHSSQRDSIYGNKIPQTSSLWDFFIIRKLYDKFSIIKFALYKKKINDFNNIKKRNV